MIIRLKWDIYGNPAQMGHMARPLLHIRNGVKMA
jgi:hypothetical protein